MYACRVEGTQSEAPPSRAIAGRMAGPWEILKPLGAGGMGSLWVARNAVSGAEAAVKLVLAKSARRDPTALARFEREARVLALVEHPHVARLLDRGELDDGMPYITMELCDGESLVARLESMQAPMPFGHVTELITQLGGALEAIHGQGIVHRDLKGEHILLTGPREGMDVKIIDFGLAKAPGISQEVQAQLTSPGSTLGSVEYMSPEQVMDSAAVDEQADLWALAVMTYIALTQEFPFKGETLRALLDAIVEGKFTPPSKLRSGVPVTVDAFFVRAFDVEMAERFPSARAMVDAFYDAIGLQREGRRTRRRTVVLLVVMLTLLAAALLTYRFAL